MYHIYHELYFTTATILNWKHLLKKDEFKDIIIESFQFLVREKRAVIYEFVIMPNHIHLIWHIPQPFVLADVKGSLLSYTAHQFKKQLKNYPGILQGFKVDLADREYQFWERNPLSISINYDKVLSQKAAYINRNPCTEKWNLAEYPEQYKYSSFFKNEDGSQFWTFLSFIS